MLSGYTLCEYDTTQCTILSKAIVVKSDLDLLKDFVNFNALTIFKPTKDEE